MGIGGDVKDLLVVIGPIVGIVGVALAIYFYYGSRRIQRPTYFVSSEISKVYDSKKTSPNLAFVKVPTNETITKDVFLVTIHFWNSGTLPIEPGDIRKPVEFNISNCEQIVDHDVVAQTDPNAVGFSLSPGNDQKTLVLSWAHLDSNHGAKFQVFYIGSPNPKYSFNGNILGKTDFVNGRSLAQRLQRGKIGEFSIGLLSGLVITLGIVGASLLARVVVSSWGLGGAVGFLIFPVLAGVIYVAWLGLVGQRTPPV